jgi:hypothetical protein
MSTTKAGGEKFAADADALKRSSTSQHIGIGIMIGALLVIFSLFFFQKTTQSKATFSDIKIQTSLRVQKVLSSKTTEEVKYIATDLISELADLKSQVKAAGALERQMTMVNEKLEKQCTRLVKELKSVTASKEKTSKDQESTALGNTALQTSVAVTPIAPIDIIAPVHAGSKSLEQMLNEHKQLQADMVSGKQPMRAITFGANGKSDVGGYGNRMIGMLSGMLLALYLDRAYYIDHSTGFKMSDYYDGSNHNIPWSHLLKTSTADVSVVDFQGAAGRVRCVTMFEKMSKSINHAHIGFQTNQDCFLDIHMQYQSLKPGLLSRRDTLTQLYNYLFKPTPMFASVLSALKPHVRTVDEFNSVQIVCTHIRTGKIKGGSDPVRQGKMGGFQHFVKNKIAPCAKLVAKNNVLLNIKDHSPESSELIPTKTRHFVAADNEEALRIFKQSMPGTVVVDASTVPGLNNVIHLARSGSQVNQEGVTRMLADFEVFRTSCDFIVLAPSTFSNLAYLTSDLRGTRGVQAFLDDSGTCRSPWHFFSDAGYGNL